MDDYRVEGEITTWNTNATDVKSLPRSMKSGSRTARNRRSISARNVLRRKDTAPPVAQWLLSSPKRSRHRHLFRSEEWQVVRHAVSRSRNSDITVSSVAPAAIRLSRSISNRSSPEPRVVPHTTPAISLSDRRATWIASCNLHRQVMTFQAFRRIGFLITAELDPRSADPIQLCADIADQPISLFCHPCADR